MLQRIYLQSGLTELGYKDRRSFKRWCENNGVEILSDNGSNKMYVLEEEFKEAKARKANDYLKRKEAELKKQNNYKPQGEHEKKFISILTRKSSEL